MGKTRKIVGVSLAVAVALGLVAYVLVPHTGPTNESVVVNQPSTPTNGGGSTTSTGPSSGTGPSTPPTDFRPAKLHGKNSEGPRHVVCLPANSHVQGVAQYQGANWYRGQCTPTPGANAQGQANGHANGAWTWTYILGHTRVGNEH